MRQRCAVRICNGVVPREPPEGVECGRRRPGRTRPVSHPAAASDQVRSAAVGAEGPGGGKPAPTAPSVTRREPGRRARSRPRRPGRAAKTRSPMRLAPRGRVRRRDLLAPLTDRRRRDSGDRFDRGSGSQAGSQAPAMASARPRQSSVLRSMPAFQERSVTQDGDAAARRPVRRPRPSPALTRSRPASPPAAGASLRELSTGFERVPFSGAGMSAKVHR